MFFWASKRVREKQQGETDKDKQVERCVGTLRGRCQWPRLEGIKKKRERKMKKKEKKGEEYL